jgi:hypothetical protein
MATRTNPAPKELYREDFYVWNMRQAELPRARSFDDLDLEHLLEELAELGDTKLSAVLNNARVVMKHLFKLEHSPGTDLRHRWRTSVLDLDPTAAAAVRTAARRSSTPTSYSWVSRTSSRPWPRPRRRSTRWLRGTALLGHPGFGDVTWAPCLLPRRRRASMFGILSELIVKIVEKIVGNVG